MGKFGSELRDHNVAEQQLQPGAARAPLPPAERPGGVPRPGAHPTRSQRQGAGARGAGAAEAAAGEPVHGVHRVRQQEPVQRQPGRVRAQVHEEQQGGGHGQQRGGRGLGHLQLPQVLLQLPCFLVRGPAGPAPSSAEAQRRPAHQHPAQVSEPQRAVLTHRSKV